jgi:homocitrate synthase
MCGNGDSNGAATNGSHPVQGLPKSSPYQSVQDYLSNVGRYKIIESTLREGEQFANSFFDTETKIKMYVRMRQFTTRPPIHD